MENRLEKKLHQTLCGKILQKEIRFPAYKLKIYVFIRDLDIGKGKVKLKGLRISGTLETILTGDKTELSDIEYKQFIETDGIVTHMLAFSVWATVLSRLKHFGIERSETEMDQKLTYMKMKRFFHHMKRYIGQ